ncbi:hypothetical protein [Hymenobacter nivis]|uniref:Uncharacterized protein n=1 Tax=Hymenobacter nivis TaxID=1850093 RepID=A0A502GY03_9BACT|nr:hypothetical protein [Hymenobacter nivis]TPG66090.1 hypothetical protein EAH73_12025 [Hymenobacter nivis]
MREAYLTGGPPAPAEAELADVNLTKVKISRKDSTLYAEYSEGESNGFAEKTALHHRPVHADLEAAFARVVPHFLLLLEMLPGVQQGEEWLKKDSLAFRYLLEDGKLHEFPELADFAVTGYSYSNNGGVVVLGRKTLRSGKVVNLTTPHEVLDPDPITGMEYEHLFSLSSELGACDKQVRQYLAGKSAPYVQQQELELDFDATDGSTLAPNTTRPSGGKNAAANDLF